MQMWICIGKVAEMEAISFQGINNNFIGWNFIIFQVIFLERNQGSAENKPHLLIWIKSDLLMHLKAKPFSNDLVVPVNHVWCFMKYIAYYPCYFKFSLQNKIWILLDRSTILAKFIYDKEGKLAGPNQILPVRVRGPALILKTVKYVHR